MCSDLVTTQTEKHDLAKAIHVDLTKKEFFIDSSIG
jgi:hypothetical protein